MDNENTSLYKIDRVQKTSHSLGNIVSIFEEYFLGFFEKGYFKTIRSKSQSNIKDFKGFMKELPFKDKPILVYDPQIEIVEDSIYNNRILPGFNKINPNAEYDAKLLYAETIACDGKSELAVRKNRFRIRFDIMMAVETSYQQIDLWNYMMMNIRHKSKFAITKKTVNLIPSILIHTMAKIANLKYDSQEFLAHLNKYSSYPIIRRLRPATENSDPSKYYFYMLVEREIYVNIPDLPARDGVEKINMIEGIARITDSIEFEIDLPAEYMLVISDETFDGHIYDVIDSNEIIYIPSYHHSLVTLETDQDMIRFNQVDLIIEKETENYLTLEDLIGDKYMMACCKMYMESNRLIDFIKFKLYKEGLFVNDFRFDSKGRIVITDPSIKSNYTLVGYVDMGTVNALTKEFLTEKIGTIAK